MVYAITKERRHNFAYRAQNREGSIESLSNIENGITFHIGSSILGT
jgi:hypothetical protein